MNQIEVQIMGQSYLLGCPPEGEAQLRDAVSRVDSAMTGIRDAGKVKSRDRIAVLAALNLAFDLVQREQDLATAQAAAQQAQAAAQAQAARADEPAAEAAANATPAATPSPAAAAAPGSSHSGGPLLSYSSTIASSPDSRAEQLLQRLDQALTSDGRLL